MLGLSTQRLVGGLQLRLEDLLFLDVVFGGVQGPFEGLMGRVEQEWDDGKRVAILLEGINKARVLIEKRWLSVMAKRV